MTEPLPPSCDNGKTPAYAGKRKRTDWLFFVLLLGGIALLVICEQRLFNCATTSVPTRLIVPPVPDRVANPGAVLQLVGEPVRALDAYCPPPSGNDTPATQGPTDGWTFLVSRDAGTDFRGYRQSEYVLGLPYNVRSYYCSETTWLTIVSVPCDTYAYIRRVDEKWARRLPPLVVPDTTAWYIVMVDQRDVNMQD